MASNTETVAAISTALGPGAISIVRLSGPSAVACTQTLFKAKSGSLADQPTHLLRYGWIAPPGNDERIDEVLVVVMRAPHSFTGEDIVEIHCHGGVVAARSILRLLLEQGVGAAAPGEFSKRAFLNGKIDLTQAEGIAAVIAAKTERTLALATRQVAGNLKEALSRVRGTLLGLLAELEANLDFSEEDLPAISLEQQRQSLDSAFEALSRLTESGFVGRILSEGVTAALVGCPNVGKSSLLNALAASELAIVTDIPGTTRDPVSVEVSFHGVPVKLVDTAGLRITTDPVEQIGVSRARQVLSQADIVVLIVEAGQGLMAQDREMLGELGKRPVLIVANKSDLLPHPPAENPSGLVLVSAKTGQGLTELTARLAREVTSKTDLSPDEPVLLVERHRHALIKALAALQEAGRLSELGDADELISVELRRALELIGEVTGESLGDSLLDEIFANFCVGK